MAINKTSQEIAQEQAVNQVSQDASASVEDFSELEQQTGAPPVIPAPFGAPPPPVQETEPTSVEQTGDGGTEPAIPLATPADTGIPTGLPPEEQKITDANRREVIQRAADQTGVSTTEIVDRAKEFLSDPTNDKWKQLPENELIALRAAAVAWRGPADIRQMTPEQLQAWFNATNIINTNAPVSESERSGLVTDVDAFNDKFGKYGITVTKENPYLTSEQETAVNTIVQQQGNARVLTEQGVIIPSSVNIPPVGSREYNTYTPEYWEKVGGTRVDLGKAAELGIPLETLNTAGYSIKPEVYRSYQSLNKFRGENGYNQYDIMQGINEGTVNVSQVANVFGQETADAWDKLRKYVSNDNGEVSLNVESVVNDLDAGNLSRDNALKLVPEDTLKQIDQYNKQAEKTQRIGRNMVNVASGIAGISPDDPSKLTTNEIATLLEKNAISVDSLLAAGNSPLNVNLGIAMVNAKAKEQQAAVDKLSSYATVTGEPSLLNFAFNATTPQITYTVKDVARFLRENPDGEKVLAQAELNPGFIDAAKDYNDVYQPALKAVNDYFNNDKYAFGSEGYAINNAIESLDIKLPPIPYKYNVRTGQYEDPENQRLLSQKDLLKYHWDGLTDDQKEAVVNAFAKDPNKGSYFGSINKLYQTIAEKGGITGQIVLSPILPVTNVIAKQITIDEAKDILKSQYKNEINVLADYVKPDGTFDIDQLNTYLFGDIYGDRTKKILEDTGYESTDELEKSLDYYNKSIKVTPEEWALAAGVGLADALTLGGSGLLTGTAGAWTARALWGVGGALFVPSAITTIKDPNAAVWQKVVAGAAPVLMLVGATGVKPGVAGGGVSKTVSGVRAVAEQSAIELPKPTLAAQVSSGLYNIGYDTARFIKDLPTNTVNAIMDAAKLVDDATAKLVQTSRVIRSYITQDLPTATVNALMDAAKLVDDTYAALRQAVVNANQYITQKLPDKLADALYDAAGDVDMAIAKIQTNLANAKIYVTKVVPNKIVNSLMDGAESLDDAIARVKQYITKDLPNNIADKLYDAAGDFDMATAKMRQAVSQAQKFITEKVPDKAVNILMDAAEGLDTAIAKIQSANQAALQYLKQTLPDLLADKLYDAAGDLDMAVLKAQQNIAKARTFITQTIPDKAVNVLMDAAEGFDNFTAKIGTASNNIKTYLTKDVPEAIADRLYDMSGDIDMAVLKAQKSIADARRFITQGLPDKAVNALMDAAQGFDNTIAKVNNLISSARQLPGGIGNRIADVLYDIAGDIDMATLRTKAAIGQVADKITGIPNNIKSAVRSATDKLGSVYDTYSGEITSGIRDAISGKPKDITWVKALNTQNKIASILQRLGVEPVFQDDIAEAFVAMSKGDKSAFDSIINRIKQNPKYPELKAGIKTSIDELSQAGDDYITFKQSLDDTTPDSLDSAIEGIENETNNARRFKDNPNLKPDTKTKIDEVIRRNEERVKELKEQRQKVQVKVKEKIDVELKPDTEVFPEGQFLPEEVKTTKIAPRETPASPVPTETPLPTPKVSPIVKTTPSSIPVTPIVPGVNAPVAPAYNPGVISYPFDPDLYPDEAAEYAKRIRELRLTPGFIENESEYNAALEKRIDELSRSMTREQAIKQALNEVVETTIIKQPSISAGVVTGDEVAQTLNPFLEPAITEETELQPQLKPAEQLKPAIEQVTEIITEPVVKTEPFPITTPEIVTKIETPEKVVEKTPPVELFAKPKGEASKIDVNNIPAGTLEWRQGVKWAVSPPPYDDIIYLDNPLPGTKKFAVGKGSAAKTLQVLGGPPPKDADVDMGWAKIHISSKNGQLMIDFAGGTAAANERWSQERQQMGEVERQSYEQLPTEPVVSRIPKPRTVAPVTREIMPNEQEYLEPEPVSAREQFINRPLIRPRTSTKLADEESQILLPRRRYLGRLLRPSSLGGI